MDLFLAGTIKPFTECKCILMKTYYMIEFMNIQSGLLQL